MTPSTSTYCYDAAVLAVVALSPFVKYQVRVIVPTVEDVPNMCDA